MIRSALLASLILAASVVFAQTNEDMIVGQPREYWNAQLQSPQAQVRKDALKKLASSGSDSTVAAVQIVSSALGDSDRTVRITAAQTLGEMGENVLAVLDTLIQALDDKDDWVRSSICNTIGKLGSKAEPAVLKIGTLAVEDESASVRITASNSLGFIAINPELSIKFLVKVLRDPVGDVRLFAAQAISHFGKGADPATLPLAFVAENDGDQRVRREAIATLGAIGAFGGPDSSKAIPYLTRILSDSDPEIRKMAAGVLSRFGEASQPAIPNLIETLRNGPPEAQVASARTLGGYGPVASSAVPVLLEKIKQQRHLQLRDAAAGALLKIDPGQLETVVEILTEGTRSGDGLVRMFSLKTLLTVDDVKRTHALPVLQRLQSDEIIEIQLAASQELTEYTRKKEYADKAAREQDAQAGAAVVSDSPKVTLKDATQEDADAALTLLRSFLALWQEGKCQEAAALVEERIREGWRWSMQQMPMRLRSIESIRVSKSSARAEITILPKGGHSLDMVFRDGRWWMTGN